MSTYLDRNEDKCDDKLRGGAYEFGRSHRLLALFKDPVNAVGLSQHGGVSDGHAKAQQEAPECAHHRTWLCDHQEGYQVDQKDTWEREREQVTPTDDDVT